jgi:putative drug exporter of the RND superfamily
MPSSRTPALQRLGTLCGRRPLLVIGVWCVLLVAVIAGSKAAGGIYSDSVNLSGTESSTGLALLRAHDPAASGYSGTVVVHSSPRTVSADATSVNQAVANLAKLGHVLSVSNPLSSSSPRVSADGQIASITIHFDVVPKTLGAGYVAQLDAAVAPMRHDGLQVEYGGSLDQLTRPKTADIRSEAIGFLVALVVLLVAFGSVAGAVLPLITAVFSVVIGVSLLSLTAAVVTFGTASPTLALMIGLGVGIDYAVFSTTRFRQQIVDGVEPAEAAGYTTATSGHAVLVAASTVTVAMLGLYASGITFIGKLGFAAVFGVVTAAAGAVTLVPAGLGLLGRRIDSVKVRSRTVAESGSDDDGWHRYAALVGRHPWRFLIAGTAVLLVLAIPLLSIRLGHVDDGADPHSYTDKRAYDLTTKGFGPGANGPFTIVVAVAHGSPPTLAQTLQRTLKDVPDVAAMSSLTPSPDGALLVGTVVPTSGPQAPATTALFDRLIHSTIPGALRGTGATGYVTGSLASNDQFASTLTSRLPIIIAVVVATAFLLIMTTFLSLLLALKAAVLNLLSIGAAYGVVVAVFQWGWGRSLLGVSENVPIESYVPMLMFAIVFGLSMDYEVFLLSRVQETWHETCDPHLAVARGLSQTARVITCAALIMVSVFTAFVGSTNVVVKMLAIGLAFSVLIDASVVRLLLVPAVMNLLGKAAWWMPSWLDGILPHIDAEGVAAKPAPHQPLPEPSLP